MFQFVVQNKKVEQKIFTQKNLQQKREYLYVRLNEIFNHIIPHHMVYKTFKGELPFEAKNPLALRILFDNQVDLEPEFSGPSFADIFFKNNQLILQISSLDSSKKIRKEILLSSIEKASFKFFGTKGKKAGWQEAWQKKDHTFPKMIYLSLWMHKTEKSIDFVFFLPTVNPLITYT